MIIEQEKKWQLEFLYFIQISKMNRERNYVTRNGKMPSYAERSSKYSYNFGLVLRKFLEGLAGTSKTYKPIDISRSKGALNYLMNMKKHQIGKSEFVDSLIRLGIKNNLIEHSSNSNLVYNYHNHKLTYSTPFFGRTEGLQYRYELNIDGEDQIFSSDFFNHFIEHAQAPLTDKDNRILLSRGLTRVFEFGTEENLFVPGARIEVSQICEELTEEQDVVVEVENINDLLLSIAVRHRTSRENVAQFVEDCCEIFRSSRGVQTELLFAHAIQCSAAGNEDYRWNEFRNIADFQEFR